MSCREQTSSAGGAPLKKTSRDVFKYMVTPDRIPEFIIPSLDILDEHRLFSKEKGPSWSSALGPGVHEVPTNSSDPSRKNNSVQPSCLPCCSGTEIDAKVDDIADPVTWAAFSLPHLPKITTPYGFMALGESPHVTKEEALFFQPDLACLEDSSKKRYSDPHVGHHCEGTYTACMDVSLEEHHRVQKVNRPALPKRNSDPIQSSSELNLSKATDVDAMDGLPKSLASFMTIWPRSHSSPEFPLQKPKRNLFKKILKKHFAHLRSLKAVTFPGH